MSIEKISGSKAEFIEKLYSICAELNIKLNVIKDTNTYSLVLV